MARQIEDILDFRSDLSPFLVHLTKKKDDKNSAKTILTKIITDKKLLQSCKKISDARFSVLNQTWPDEKNKTLFSAISFTETPLNEIHCMLEIDRRSTNLEPYGLVFLKSKLQQKKVSPVLYINNFENLSMNLLYALGDVISNENYDEELNKIFPLISIMGSQLKPRRSTTYPEKLYNFYWEREWRLPYCYGDFCIDPEDIFIGLCPDEDIAYFEQITNEIFGETMCFIDPTKNAKWYAKKLIERRKKCELTVSVV